ncbi:hypothetical protein [Streptomyces sp. NPDC052179]|uniref:hypothetical protein n=1 Tax=Streptomyces sp. NPDC052179 TaxID=3155680 RepID=UPI0034433050
MDGEPAVANLVTRDPATGLHRGPVLWPDGTPPPPFGCRRCGADQQRHGGAGHRWERPTLAQILVRCKARHAARSWAAAEGRRLDLGYTWIAHTDSNTPPARCNAMNHNSVGSERFCERDFGHDPDEDHDAGDMTWPCED